MDFPLWELKEQQSYQTTDAAEAQQEVVKKNPINEFIVLSVGAETERSLFETGSNWEVTPPRNRINIRLLVCFY